MTPATPFGKYADLLTTAIAAFLVVAAVIMHALGLEAERLTLVDAGAFMALGAIFGKLSAANGYAAQARAAHARLDAIGAPPAGDPTKVA